MNTLQNPIRELRQVAGYETPTALARELRVAPGTVLIWEAGRGFPVAGNMLKLASAFRIELAECVRRIWNENIGDLCPCGCGGKKVFPTHKKAQRLSIQLPCTDCGAIRIYRRGSNEKHVRHSKRCMRCEFKKRDRHVRLVCGGIPLFKKCGRGVWVPPSEVPRHKYQCRSCASYLRAIRKKKEQVLGFLRGAAKFFCKFPLESAERKLFIKYAGFDPKNRAPKIQSLTRLEELWEACFKLSYKDAAGDVVSFTPDVNPGLAESWSRKERKVGTRKDSISQTKGLLAFYAGKPRADGSRLQLLPRPIKVLCPFCHKAVCSQGNRKPPKSHRSCFLNWRDRTPEGLEYHLLVRREAKKHTPSPFATEDPKPGGQVTPEVLNKHWYWALRSKLGEHLSDLAEEFGVTKSAIEMGIESIKTYLDPEKVPQAFKDRVLMVLSESTVRL